MINVDAFVNDVISGKNAAMNKNVNKYSLPSRGRKQCPNCQAYVGVRLQKCECGYEFKKGQSVSQVQTATEKNTQYEEPVSDEDRRYAMAVGLNNGCTIIYAGSGKCPAAFTTTDYKGIAQFCEDVVASGLKDKKLYMPEAIKCWIRGFIDVDDEDYGYVCKLVDQWHEDRVKSTLGMEVVNGQ